MSLPAGDPHLDVTMFRKLGVLMPAAALQQLVDTYVHDAEKRIDRISAAVAADDADSAHHAAHSLRGSSGMLGFVRMASLCSWAETLAEGGDIAGVGPMVAGMREELEHLRALMTSVVTLLPEELQNVSRPE